MIAPLAPAAFAAALAAAAPSGASRGVAVAVTATATDADVLARAKTVLAELQEGTIDRSELSPALSREYTPAVLAASRQTIPAGAPASVVRLAKTTVDGVTTYVFRATWPQGTLDYTFGFDARTYEIVKLYVRTGPPA